MFSNFECAEISVGNMTVGVAVEILMIPVLD